MWRVISQVVEDSAKTCGKRIDWIEVGYGTITLLLVILGVILVGIAIFIGVQMFPHNAVDDVRNAVMTDLNNYASRALAYYGKP